MPRKVRKLAGASCFRISSVEVEGATHELVPGSGIELPSGTAHQVRNSGDTETRFLVVSSPPHQGDRRDTGQGEA